MQLKNGIKEKPKYRDTEEKLSIKYNTLSWL